MLQSLNLIWVLAGDAFKRTSLKPASKIKKKKPSAQGKPLLTLAQDHGAILGSREPTSSRSGTRLGEGEAAFWGRALSEWHPLSLWEDQILPHRGYFGFLILPKACLYLKGADRGLERHAQHPSLLLPSCPAPGYESPGPTERISPSGGAGEGPSRGNHKRRTGSLQMPQKGEAAGGPVELSGCTRFPPPAPGSPCAHVGQRAAAAQPETFPVPRLLSLLSLSLSSHSPPPRRETRGKKESGEDRGGEPGGSLLPLGSIGAEREARRAARCPRKARAPPPAASWLGKC